MVVMAALAPAGLGASAPRSRSLRKYFPSRSRRVKSGTGTPRCRGRKRPGRTGKRQDRRGGRPPEDVVRRTAVACPGVAYPLERGRSPEMLAQVPQVSVIRPPLNQPRNRQDDCRAEKQSLAVLVSIQSGCRDAQCKNDDAGPEKRPRCTLFLICHVNSSSASENLLHQWVVTNATTVMCGAKRGLGRAGRRAGPIGPGPGRPRTALPH